MLFRSDQMRRAWLDFLEASCAREPLLILLEDLHWGDLPTVQYLDDALRRLGDRPWMLLALARPEVHDLFPGLWAGREVQEIRLKPLSVKASARLARQVLGDGVNAEMLERLVVQANGNAFYLEELIRTAATGSTEALPETVLSEKALSEKAVVGPVASTTSAPVSSSGCGVTATTRPSCVDEQLTSRSCSPRGSWAGGSPSTGSCRRTSRWCCR